MALKPFRNLSFMSSHQGWWLFPIGPRKSSLQGAYLEWELSALAGTTWQPPEVKLKASEGISIPYPSHWGRSNACSFRTYAGNTPPHQKRVFIRHFQLWKAHLKEATLKRLESKGGHKDGESAEASIPQRDWRCWVVQPGEGSREASQWSSSTWRELLNRKGNNFLHNLIVIGQW